MDALRSALFGIVATDQPMTVRQADFYCAVSAGIVPMKTCRCCISLLLVGCSWTCGSTGRCRGAGSRTTRDGSGSRARQMVALCGTARYRSARSPRRLGQINTFTSKLPRERRLGLACCTRTRTGTVPFMVTRGYPSLSYLHEAAEAIAEQGRPAFLLYYFGDHDPSGVVHLNGTLVRGSRSSLPARRSRCRAWP